MSNNRRRRGKRRKKIEFERCEVGGGVANSNLPSPEIDDNPGEAHLVVVGGDGLWNCHVHTNDIGASIEVALDLEGGQASEHGSLGVVEHRFRARQPQTGEEEHEADEGECLRECDTQEHRGADHARSLWLTCHGLDGVAGEDADADAGADGGEAVGHAGAGGCLDALEVRDRSGDVKVRRLGGRKAWIFFCTSMMIVTLVVTALVDFHGLGLAPANSVLTAAHCVDEGVQPSQITVSLEGVLAPSNSQITRGVVAIEIAPTSAAFSRLDRTAERSRASSFPVPQIGPTADRR